MNLLEGGDQTTQLKAEIEAKWKDKPIEQLLAAKVESDLYIKTLEAQKDELRRDYLAQRDELLAKAKFEEYIDQIKNTSPKEPVTPSLETKDSHTFDPNEFKKLAAETYQEFEVRKQEADNFKKVESKLRERYGDNYSSVLKDQQNNLGLSADEINGLAKKSPEAFFRLMGLNDTNQNSFQTPPRGSMRNDNFSPKGATVRDWGYYQEMKKSNPKLYLDPKIQVQMHNDAISLGDRFGLPSD